MGARWTRIDRHPRTPSPGRAGRSVRRGLLYAGTEFGCTTRWTTAQLGALVDLPLVPVTDLAIRDDDLIAATQGRGTGCSTILRSCASSKEGTRLYAPGTSTVCLRADARPCGGEWHQSYPGVTFFYALELIPDDDAVLELAVFEDSSDEAIWTWSRAPEEAGSRRPQPPRTDVLTADAGLNRTSGTSAIQACRFDDLVMWADMREGPQAVPGAYQARLTVGGEVQEVAFEVLPDPRSSSTAEDFAAQFDFVREARDLLTRTHDEIVRIGAIRAQLEGVKGRLDETTLPIRSRRSMRSSTQHDRGAPVPTRIRVVRIRSTSRSGSNN